MKIKYPINETVQEDPLFWFVVSEAINSDIKNCADCKNQKLGLSGGISPSEKKDIKAKPKRSENFVPKTLALSKVIGTNCNEDGWMIWWINRSARVRPDIDQDKKCLALALLRTSEEDQMRCQRFMIFNFLIVFILIWEKYERRTWLDLMSAY